MNEISLWDMYQWNERFKGYVDRYCSCYHIEVEIALRHKMIHLYAKHCLDKE